jgi:hypothetical protein
MLIDLRTTFWRDEHKTFDTVAYFIVVKYLKLFRGYFPVMTTDCTIYSGQQSKKTGLFDRWIGDR